MSIKSTAARKLLAASTGVVLLGGVATALSAHAGTADAFSCTFNGATDALTPIAAPPAHGTPSQTGLTEEGDAKYTTGMSGAFHFSGTATCSGTDVSAGITFTNAAATIDSSGSYQNIVCGTGEAVSASDGVHGAIGDAAATPATVTVNGLTFKVYYTIDFSDGQGTLAADVVFPDGDVVDGGGAVDILPSNTGGCVTGPVLGFNVEGSTTGSGTGSDEAGG